MSNATVAKRRIVGRAYGAIASDNRKRRLDDRCRPFVAPEKEKKLPGYHKPKKQPEELRECFIRWTIVRHARRVDVNIDTVMKMHRSTSCSFRKGLYEQFIAHASVFLTEDRRTVIAVVVAEGDFPTNPRAGSFVRVRIDQRIKVGENNSFVLPKSVLTKML